MISWLKNVKPHNMHCLKSTYISFISTYSVLQVNKRQLKLLYVLLFVWKRL